MATATATKPDADKPAAEGKAKSKKKMIIIVVAVLLVAAGAYKFVLAKPAKAGPPVGGDIVAMDPSTVNLSDGHYLKLAVAVQLVKGKATVEEFKTSEAAELVIDEFSDRSVASVSTTKQRTKLADELETKIKKAYDGEVYKIFITQFVTQ